MQHQRHAKKAYEVAIVIAFSGCGFQHGALSTTDGGTIDDGDLDADIDSMAADAVMSGVDFLPTSEETFSSTNWSPAANVTINTTAMTITPNPPAGVTFMVGQQETGSAVVILRVGDFAVASGRLVTVTGDKPLVILSDHDVTIAGTLDVGARKGERGPGGALPGIGSGAGGISVHDNGSGSTYDDSGAGGGSFGSQGAAGGKAGPFEGGPAGNTYPINGLIGGSGGGLAGACSNVPGAGGGALFLYAKHKMRISGAIRAGGGGGGGGTTTCPTGSGAGAGGGSGGLIWLQTPDLDGTGVLAANGGGGGGGSYVGVSNGGDGEDGRASATVAAAGGTKANSAEASAGGNGAVQGMPAPAIPSLTAGNGGGGGGGLGRVVYHAPSVGSLSCSPTAVTP